MNARLSLYAKRICGSSSSLVATLYLFVLLGCRFAIFFGLLCMEFLLIWVLLFYFFKYLTLKLVSLTISKYVIFMVNLNM